MYKVYYADENSLCLHQEPISVDNSIGNIIVRGEENVSRLPKAACEEPNNVKLGVAYGLKVIDDNEEEIMTSHVIFFVGEGKIFALVHVDDSQPEDSYVEHYRLSPDDPEYATGKYALIRDLRDRFHAAMNDLEDGVPVEIKLAIKRPENPDDGMSLNEEIRKKLDRIESYLKDTPVITASFPEKKVSKKVSRKFLRNMFAEMEEKLTKAIEENL